MLDGARYRTAYGSRRSRAANGFAVAGMLGAPLGSHPWTLVSEKVLLVMFAVLMLVVAYRLWSKARVLARHVAWSSLIDSRQETQQCSPKPS